MEERREASQAFSVPGLYGLSVGYAETTRGPGVVCVFLQGGKMDWGPHTDCGSILPHLYLVRFSLQLPAMPPFHQSLG